VRFSGTDVKTVRDSEAIGNVRRALRTNVVHSTLDCGQAVCFFLHCGGGKSSLHPAVFSFKNSGCGPKRASNGSATTLTPFYDDFDQRY